MTTPINLNKARKARDRADAKKKAAENSVKFGRTKAQRLLEAAQTKQAQDRLSQLKFDEDER